MRLIRAELLKLRKRWATYVVLGIVLSLMALVYLLIGVLARGNAAGGLAVSGPCTENRGDRPRSGLGGAGRPWRRTADLTAYSQAGAARRPAIKNAGARTAA